jgi:hypothetical protein
MKRRWTDKIRMLADELWKAGKKEIAGDLHEVARKAEKEREDEYNKNRN